MNNNITHSLFNYNQPISFGNPIKELVKVSFQVHNITCPVWSISGHILQIQYVTFDNDKVKNFHDSLEVKKWKWKW